MREDNAYTEYNMKAAVLALFLMIALIPAAGVAGQNDIHDSSSKLHTGRQGVPGAGVAPGTPVRIRFAAGTIAATRTGHLAPLASDLFVLAAQRGQALEAFVESTDALLAVWGPDGSELVPGAEQMAAWRVLLPARGDYFIAVNSTGPATDYKLTVIIDTPGAAGATRIRFAAGSTSATVGGRITAGTPARYVLRALADQMLMVSATGPGLLYCVVGADGGVVIPFSAGPGAWRPVLPATQDYTIVLVSPDAAATYTLTVSASPLRPTPTPTPQRSRVQFQPGATSAAVSGELAPGGTRTYLLRASAGQIMQVTLWANVGARILIWGADGSRLNRGMEEEGWQGTLPKTQDYFIQVVGGDQALSYCLRATVFARIQFARGAVSATVTSPTQTCVPQGVEVVGAYALRASAGQTLRVTLNSPNNDVLLTVVGADGTPVKYYDDWSTTWEGVLPTTQDYHLLLVATGGDSRFTMTVMARTPSQTPPTRIRFVAGTTSATVSGSLAQGTPARYVLWAARDQRLEIRIWPAPTEYAPPRLNVTVAGPGGAAWSDLTLDDAIDPLPASGDYIITLALQPGSPGTGYIMEVAIPAP